MSEYQKVFLIGAARSGTKIVRDVLAQHSKISKVPYDINFVWKYGNEDKRYDDLSINDIDSQKKKFIDNYLCRYANSQYLLEKTVGNTLRVNLLHKLYPEAQFIHLIRNGIDVAESVSRQWNKVPDKSYIFRKLQHVPKEVYLTYGVQYLKKIFDRLVGRGEYANVWGVIYPGIYEDIQNMELIEVCAKQWNYCVKKSLKDLEKVSRDNYLEIKYEDLVTSPKDNLEEITQFLNIDLENQIKFDKLSSEYIGRGLEKLSSGALAKVINIEKTTLEKLRYKYE